jgi:hypothetical protein
MIASNGSNSKALCKSETGADMQVFESSSQDGRMGLTSGNDESAGKIKSTKTPKEIAISNEFLFKRPGRFPYQSCTFKIKLNIWLNG